MLGTIEKQTDVVLEERLMYRTIERQTGRINGILVEYQSEEKNEAE